MFRLLLMTCPGELISRPWLSTNTTRPKGRSSSRADATVTTGNECNLSFELAHVCSPSLFAVDNGRHLPSSLERCIRMFGAKKKSRRVGQARKFSRNGPLSEWTWKGRLLASQARRLPRAATGCHGPGCVLAGRPEASPRTSVCRSGAGGQCTPRREVWTLSENASIHSLCRPSGLPSRSPECLTTPFRGDHSLAQSQSSPAPRVGRDVESLARSARPAQRCIAPDAA
jgi:hypothetical protein